MHFKALTHNIKEKSSPEVDETYWGFTDDILLWRIDTDMKNFDMDYITWLCTMYLLEYVTFTVIYAIMEYCDYCDTFYV